MIRGSCLCRAVTFSIDGQLRSARYCHCATCRKFSGSAAAAWAIANASEVVSTADVPVSGYPSGRGTRCFCSTCGSPVWFESDEHPEILAIPLGALDDGEVAAPEMHLWTGSQPAWSSICDELPQHGEGPPESSR